MQDHGLASVCLHGVHESCLVTSLGDFDGDRTLAQAAEPDSQLLMVGGQLGNQDLARDGSRLRFLPTVNLLHEMFPQFGSRCVFHFFHNPTALAPDPPASDMKHLDCSFELVLFDSENICVGVFR